ncbi:MAG: CRISPR system precrRNA processing endoribonuclease RAMP protein Cas6 [Gammaproteobacteria bacterium]
MALARPEIPFSVYRFEYRILKPFVYENYPGFIWRGALGYALREVSCTMGKASCQGCPLSGSCAHSVLFEEFPHPFISTVYDTKAVKPYVIATLDGNDEKPFTKTVDVLLIGRANYYYPYLLQAMRRAGEKGIGEKRSPLRLQCVTQMLPTGQSVVLVEDTLESGVFAQPPQAVGIVDIPEQVSIQLQTSVKLKEKAKRGSSGFVQNWLQSLVRRVADLGSYWHAPVSSTGDRIREARQVIAPEPTLHWQSHERFSSRQKRSIYLGGYLGEMNFDVRDTPQLWPWIWVGQWFGVGKGATMGLGRYRVM